MLGTAKSRTGRSARLVSNLFDQTILQNYSVGRVSDFSRNQIILRSVLALILSKEKLDLSRVRYNKFFLGEVF